MSFWSGFAAGIAATAALLQVLFAALVVPPLRTTLVEFQGQIPTVTRLATSAAWTWGVPLAVLAALVIGIKLARSERGRFAACVATALMAAIALVFTCWASYLPIWQLAGNIAID